MQKTQESFIHRLQKKLLLGVLNLDLLFHNLLQCIVFHIILVSRERDSYRQQLDCYEKELTVNIGTTDNPHSAALMNSRVDSLEKSLQGYRELVAKLEEDIANMSQFISTTHLIFSNVIFTKKRFHLRGYAYTARTTVSSSGRSHEFDKG